jgi:hypothetical protein
MVEVKELFLELLDEKEEELCDALRKCYKNAYNDDSWQDHVVILFDDGDILVSQRDSSSCSREEMFGSALLIYQVKLSDCNDYDDLPEELDGEEIGCIFDAARQKLK